MIRTNPLSIHHWQFIAIIVLIMGLMLQNTGCSTADAHSPVITSIEVTNISVYPAGSTEIRCEALDPNGNPLIFRWSSTGGSITGTGPVVTWNAPNTYGDYHIMVSVKNNNGGVVQKTFTISVVHEQGQPDCATCGR